MTILFELAKSNKSCESYVISQKHITRQCSSSKRWRRNYAYLSYRPAVVVDEPLRFQTVSIFLVTSADLPDPYTRHPAKDDTCTTFIVFFRFAFEEIACTYRLPANRSIIGRRRVVPLRSRPKLTLLGRHVRLFE